MKEIELYVKPIEGKIMTKAEADNEIEIKRLVRASHMIAMYARMVYGDFRKARSSR